MVLNRIQVEAIERYLKKSGIESRMIYEDFLDHLCSITEQKMSEGVDFEDAFGLAVAYLPYSEIKTTEEYTLKLLNMETSFSRRISLLATIPFVLFGISWALSNSAFYVPLFVDTFLFYSSIITMFVMFSIGWVKDFPRWSIPSIGFCLLFSLFFMSVAIPSISRELLGLWAWLPFLITIAVSIAIKPSLKPLKMLGKRIKEEPALVLFALYGFAPFILFLTFDSRPGFGLSAVLRA